MASDSMSLARWWSALCAGEIVSQVSLTEMAAFYDGPTNQQPKNPGLAVALVMAALFD